MSKHKQESPTSSNMEIISKINAVRITSSESTEIQNQESFEWKVDLSSKEDIYSSPMCYFENNKFRYGFNKHLSFYLWLHPDDNGLSNVRVILTRCVGFSFPLILEFSYCLNDQVYNVDEPPLILPSNKSINKQIKSTELVIYNDHENYRQPSKEIILCKSADFFTLTVDNVVSIEFTVTIKS